MPSASAQLTGLQYVSESSYGVASGTTFKRLRFTGTSLNLGKQIFESNEIRSDRQRTDVRHGMHEVKGDVDVELGLTTFDDMIAAAVAGTWAAVTTGTATISAAATNTYTRASGSFVSDGFLPGDEITVTGFATPANNGRTKVVSVVALTLTVEKTTLVNEAGGGDETVAMVGKRVKSGTTLSTFTFERAFTDVARYLHFSGVAVDQAKLTVKPEAIVTMQLALLGKDMTADGTSAASGGLTAAATNSPFDAFSGTLEEGGSAIASVSGLELTIANGRQVHGVIGQRSPQEVFEGRANITGQLTAFFANQTLLDKFINETESSLDVLLQDPNGTDFHRIRLPRIKYTGGSLDNPTEGPVTLTLPFTALLDSAASTSLIYQRSNS